MESKIEPCRLTVRGVPTPTECEPITSILSHLEAAIEKSSARPIKKIHPLHVDKLDNAATPRRLHISLSATLNIKTEQRQEFLEQMQKTVRADPFQVRFVDLQWVSNHDSSRWFLVLTCQEHPSLQQLLHHTNSVATNFGQNLLYQQQKSRSSTSTTSGSAQDASKIAASSTAKIGVSNDEASLWVVVADQAKQEGSPIPQQTMLGQDGNWKVTNESLPFHISIAWCLNPPSSLIRAPMSIAAIKAVMDNEMAQIHPQFERIKVKVGDQITSLLLGNPDLRNRYL